MRADATVWVQKFGGTSVADAGLIRDAAERIETRRSAGHHVVVVVSAMGDTTDRLLAIARQVSDHPPRRELDVLLSAGEIQSMALLAIALERRGIDAISFTGAQGGVFTDDHHSQARITKIATERVEAELERGRVVVLAGFQGVTHDDHVTTLGRGGSDTSTVAMAAALGAKCCEILTDVPGVFTADPRVVPTARLLDEITYDEMLEMATFGARVLHNRAVDLAARYRVPLIVGPAHGDAPGTRVVAREKAKAMEAPVVRAITEDPSVQKISFLEVPDRPGIAAQVFALLGGRGIPLRLIVQAQSHAGHNDITFVAPSEIEVPDELLDDVVRTVGGRTTLRDPNVGLLSVVGDGIAGAPGMVGRIFQVLADAEINIDLISSSNLVITCCVPQAQLQRGARALHAALIES